MFFYFVVVLCVNLKTSLFDKLILLTENPGNITLHQEDYIQELNSISANIYVDVFYFSIGIAALNESQSIPRIIYECIGLKSFKAKNCLLKTLSEDFKKLINLEHLVLNNNNFTEIPAVIFSLINLKKLEMNENSIKMISSDIKHLKQLEILELEKNCIIHIPTVFNELKHLLILNLSHNTGLFVPNMFTTVGNKHINFFNTMNTLDLKFLYLDNTNLQFIPKNFKFKNIEEFHAKNNKLNRIDMNTLKDCFLKKIFLNSNNFNEFPMSILMINNIDLIALDSNNIRKINIDDIIAPNLTYLALNHNKIRDFYICANAVPSLKVLRLGDNNIKKFIMNARNISSLEELYLRKNNISIFDNKLTGFANLEFLDLRENNIYIIDNLNDISYQEITLKLRVNCIDEIKNLVCTRHITKISVSCKFTTNNESKLNIFENYTEANNIKIIKLKFCHLKKIPKGIEKLISVENLSFKNNNIRKVYNCFKGLKFLKILDLSYNKINFIDSDILLLESLEKLNLEHNSLSRFPPSIKYFNQKKLEIKWHSNIIRPFGKGLNIGWMEIPLHYAPLLGIVYSEKHYKSNMAVDLYKKHFKDLYRWNVKEIAQIISNEPNDEYLSYSEIMGLWNLYLKPNITAGNIIDSIKKYIDALYKVNNITIPYVIRFTLKQYDIIKIYLTAVFNFIKDKNDPHQIENICTAISQETLFCYDAQYEILQHIYISLKTGKSFDITYFIKEMIYKIKYDILSRIVTSNTDAQNVHNLAYWRNELSEEIGFIKNESKYTYMRKETLIDNKQYILYQFFLLFKVEKVVTEILEKINKNANFLCLTSQFIVERETKESKLKKYMEFDNFDLLDIRSITNKGVIFILESMGIALKKRYKFY